MWPVRTRLWMELRINCRRIKLAVNCFPPGIYARTVFLTVIFLITGIMRHSFHIKFCIITSIFGLLWVWSDFFEYILDVWKHTLHFYILVSISALVTASVVSTRISILNGQIIEVHVIIYLCNSFSRSILVSGHTQYTVLRYVVRFSVATSIGITFFSCSTFAWTQLISIFICNPITSGVCVGLHVYL